MVVWRILYVIFVLGLFGPRTRVRHIEWLTNPDAASPDAVHDLILSLSDEAREIRFQIAPNLDVLSRSLNVQHVQQDGIARPLLRQTPQAPSVVYKGSAWLRSERGAGWASAGWARLAHRKRNGRHLLEGAFRLHGESYHVALDSTYRQTRMPGDPHVPQKDSPYMVIWRDADMVPDHAQANLLGRSVDGPTCATDHYYNNSAVSDISARQIGQPPFDPFGTIGSTQGCFSTRRVALLGVATDCTYTASFSSPREARDNVISQINVASQVYEDTFNISLVIQNLTISDASCPARETPSTPWNVACTAGFDLSSRLSTFSAWRGQFDDGNAIWTLLSACNTGQAVGIAWLSSVCSRGARSQGGGRGGGGGNAQSFASTNVVVRTRAEWQIIAHEIGHNFGATHDCTRSECGSGSSARGSGNCCSLSTSTCDAGGRYLMNPVTGSSIRDFSPCSVGAVCTGIGRDVIDTSCFVGPDQAPDINESECGNGVVEGGEECDCGGEENCRTSSCCDPATCLLRANADCDPTNDLCCTDSCRVAGTGLVCRGSTGTCDPQETCDGRSAQCPRNIFEPDGQSCGDGDGNGSGNGNGGSGDGLTCASGRCTSRDLQCTNAYNETQAEVRACDGNSCQLSCNVPGVGCSTSTTMQNFLDGTPCGNGRRCLAGSCERPGFGGGGGGGGGGGNGGGGDGGGGAQDWFDRNRNWVIGVAAGVGGLIVLIIVCCMISSCRKKKGAKTLMKRGGSGPLPGTTMAHPAHPAHHLVPYPGQYPPHPPPARARYA
ncbi:Disintegrin and metalloproteinase domain-containing protein B [Colletotrichum tanaceti]|nr:Disintegrin and metalloproteinase domain-containing protein B [Colletotrichum tanaceti]